MRLLLSTRIALLVTSSVAIVLIAVLAALGYFGSRAIQDDARSDLSRSGAVLDRIFRSEAAFLQEQAKLLAQQTWMRDLVVRTDHSTLLDTAQDLIPKLRADAIRITDRDGLVLADTSEPAVYRKQPVDLEIVQEGLNGAVWTGIVRHHGALALQVLVPIRINGFVWGTLTTTIDLNARLATEMSRMLGTGMAFVDDGHITASNLPIDGSVPTPVEVPESVHVADKRYLALYRSTPFAHGDQRIGYVTLTDYDAAMATYERFKGTVVAIAICALIWSLLSARFVSRSITRPLTSVVEAARALRSGDWTSQVQVTRQDEIGELQSAFNEMSAAWKQIDEGNIATIQALAAAVDAKDSYTEGHSRRVAGYGAQLAKAIGLSAKEIDEVFMSGTLHDVGKIGIPDAILQFPGKLSSEEREIMESHPVLGFAIVSKAPQLHHLLPGIRHHHERWDGSGYPDQLSGARIPLMARILAVADAFDAMTSDRPYRRGLNMQIALAEIRKGAGAQFDPDLAEAFVELWGISGDAYRRAA